jgi:hypothetical protein
MHDDLIALVLSATALALSAGAWVWIISAERRLRAALGGAAVRQAMHAHEYVVQSVNSYEGGEVVFEVACECGAVETRLVDGSAVAALVEQAGSTCTAEEARGALMQACGDPEAALDLLRGG